MKWMLIEINLYEIQHSSRQVIEGDTFEDVLKIMTSANKEKYDPRDWEGDEVELEWLRENLTQKGDGWYYHGDEMGMMIFPLEGVS